MSDPQSDYASFLLNRIREPAQFVYWVAGTTWGCGRISAPDAQLLVPATVSLMATDRLLEGSYRIIESQEYHRLRRLMTDACDNLDRCASWLVNHLDVRCEYDQSGVEAFFDAFPSMHSFQHSYGLMALHAFFLPGLVAMAAGEEAGRTVRLSEDLVTHVGDNRYRWPLRPSL